MPRLLFFVAFAFIANNPTKAKSKKKGKKVPVTCIYSLSKDPNDFDGAAVALCFEQYEEVNAEFQCSMMNSMPHYKRLMGKQCKKLGFGNKRKGMYSQLLSEFLNRSDESGDGTDTASVPEDNSTKMELLYKDFLKAIEARDFEGIKSIVGSVEDVNSIRMKNGTTALHLASSLGEPEIVRYLLEMKAEVNARDSTGGTALMSACMPGYTAPANYEEIVSQLLRAGAEVDFQETGKGQFKGTTALMKASLFGQAIIVKLLTEAKASVNIRDAKGWTAVFYAVDADSPETVAALIKAGADTKLKDKRGKTALEFAQKKGNAKLIELLKTN